MTNCHEGSLNDLAEFGRSAFDVTWDATGRGFRVGTFRDRYGQECSIQESSLATENAIWLGPDPCRMHLTIEQVRGLVHVLTDYLMDGSLRAQYPDQRVDPEAEDDEEEDEETTLEDLRDAAKSILWMAKAYAEGGGSGGPEMQDYEAAAAIIEGDDQE